MFVIIDPATNDRVYQCDQIDLLGGRVRTDKVPHLGQERFRVPGRGLDEQFVPVAANIPTQKVKPLIYRRYYGFFAGQRQSPFGKESRDHRFHLCLQ